MSDYREDDQAAHVGDKLQADIEWATRIVRNETYLPMDCPRCKRHRMMIVSRHVVCEKCGHDFTQEYLDSESEARG